MKRLMLSAAIAALILPVAACAGEQSKSREKVAEAEAAAEQPAAEPASDTELPAAKAPDVKVSYLGATDISAKALLGEEIYGDKGESVAHVDDILIGNDGSADRVVYVTGGVAGVGGKKSTIEFDTVRISIDDPASAVDVNDPLLRLSLTADQLKAAPDFVQDGADDYRLASELLGATIDLAALPGDNGEAIIDDLIMTKDGRVKDVIVQRSMMGAIGGGDRYAYDFSLLSIEEGDGGGLALNVTEEQLNGANKFEYKRSDAVDEAAETAKDPYDQN